MCVENDLVIGTKYFGLSDASDLEDDNINLHVLVPKYMTAM